MPEAEQNPGGELLSNCLAQGPLAVDAWLSLAVQLTQALVELHQAGMVHNGVRPEAILWNAGTARAWLFDLGDAAAPAVRAPAPRLDPHGTARLVYASPEQTGRLGRGVDARSDLYALGVVLYEALTGAPPFASTDALAQIHWHIAGAVRAPAAARPEWPAVLSDIVLKLLAKTPEERYASARGLLHDLTACVRAWAQDGRIEPFPIARHDGFDRLAVSRRLYGRERELHMLLEAFERAAAGDAGRSMMLIEGYSGIGKTALIQQLVRPVVRRRGAFTSGKFDQVVRGVPFGALIQAFRGLVRGWLSESETQLAQRREVLSAALGGNGGVLAAVIPEIEFILGAQPVPVELGNVEAQNRFQRVLQSFLGAVARPEQVLVLFLDDLQWADAATLGLLEPLLAGGEVAHLMLMGAYRDHELDASPRLVQTFTALTHAGVELERLSLGPLQLEHVAGLVADSLHCSAAQALALAELVHARTDGNPFFVIQLLEELVRDGHLRFDAEAGRWAYRLDDIAGAPLADNVIDLMTRKVRRLPPRTQDALTLAACIGNRFDLRTLSIVSEQGIAQAADTLEPALSEGLIVRSGRREGDARAPDVAGAETGETFAFLHDRVQQSAYAMIPDERRQMVHLSVGRLLRARAADAAAAAADYDLVHHLNLGRALIQAPTERREVAHLNLLAGRRVKASTAYDTALELFQAGCDLLAADAWQTEHELAFELHLDAAEALTLTGQSDAALSALGELAARTRSSIEHARVMRQRSLQFEALARYGEAIAATRLGLTPFGVSFPDAEIDKANALEREIAAIAALRGGREIAALIELPTMHDAQVRMVMSMLTDIWASTFIIGDPTLARLISATMVRLSLEHGNVEESAYGYVTHAITVGPLRGEYDAAYAYGRLALDVNARFDDTRRRAKIYQQFHAHVNLWCRPFHTCLPYAREACRSGLDSGDFLYAAYAAGTEPWSAIVATQDLADFIRAYTPHVGLIEKLRNPGFADSVRLFLNWARALQGATRAPTDLSDAAFDEAGYARAYAANPFFSSIHAVARLHVCALLGTSEQAVAAALHSASLIHNLPGTIWPVIHEFWHALTLAGALDDSASEQRDAWLPQIRAAHQAFQARARFCTENFGCQALLLGAELARIEGRGRDAIEGFEAAIEFGAAHALLPLEALSLELLGRYRAGHGQERMSRNNFALARDAYASWGAEAKAAALEREHRALAPRAPRGLAPHRSAAAGDARDDANAASETTSADAAGGLDLFSVLKASQAIAGEWRIEALLARLLHITIENAGAERGALVLEADAGALVYSTASPAPGGAAASSGVALDATAQLPLGIVNYVRRTGEALVFARVDDDAQHADDAYVALHRPRSVACLPVRKPGRAIGVLYLEHRHADGVFTPQRVRTLGILASQAAISLDNARLIAALELENEQRRQAQDELGAALAEVERLKADLEAENSYLRRDLIANVSHDLRTPLVSMRGYLELLAAKGEQLGADERSQYLGIAVRQSEHLAKLIDELFELAKLDFKGMTLVREPFSFAELASDVVQKFALDARARQIEVRIHAAPRLPFVDADLSLMERVLENLVGNALAHTPAGGRVEVSVRTEGERLFAEVADTGSGIGSADLPFVFDRFYRGANGRAAGRGGAGLGLAISKRIVELHDGEIGVRSDGRSGTRFAFSVPLQARQFP